MLLPDDHGVAAHGPIVVQEYEELLVLEDELAGIARFVAENARHIWRLYRDGF
jgi:hypothetical protein